MDALDDVMARLQAMADDVPMDDPVPPQQAGTPLIELPYFIAAAAADPAPGRVYLNEATRMDAYLSELPQHPQSERCTQECVDGFLDALSIPADEWQRRWLYKLLCEHPRG